VWPGGSTEYPPGIVISSTVAQVPKIDRRVHPYSGSAWVASAPHRFYLYMLCLRRFSSTDKFHAISIQFC
jgi:hypothetical protein